MSQQKIAETAADAGVTPDTLRYYERVGLLGRPDRSSNGYRLYDEETTRRVLFIKGAQRMGLRLREIKELLEIRDRGACPCGHTRTLVEQRIGEVESELARLDGLRADLSKMLTDLDLCADQPADTWWCEAEFMRNGGEKR